MGEGSMRVGTWNTWWAKPGTDRGRAVALAISELCCDVFVATEVVLGVLPPGGYVVDAGTDWGIPASDPARRKVAMWSARPWEDVDVIGDPALPSGRYVAGTTETAIGPVRCVGVCIPWRGAHVRGGRQDRAPWEDHLAFLRGLRPMLEDETRPVVVAGDFNQAIPRGGQVTSVATAMAATFAQLDVVTAGATPLGPLIDHIATDGGLRASLPQVLDRIVGGVRVSDHLGVSVELSLDSTGPVGL